MNEDISPPMSYTDIKDPSSNIVGNSATNVVSATNHYGVDKAMVKPEAIKRINVNSRHFAADEELGTA